MQELLRKANNIELKAKQLRSKMEMLEKENAYFKEENKNLVEKLKQQKGIIQELELKANHKVPGTPENLDSPQRAEIISKIEGHVKEIDQVIEVLRSN
ncbi:hypothetical protein [Portibacter marinus]|uniref:hypothetical protein n=1 Tax=Portibacter marinus TaxID=2898660 RepID=UPI001F1B8C8D|nr:hypothetical protein [Portibacter marinus]